MIEDAELLRRYAAERSEAAFAELVRRRLDLVYSVALRQVGGDVHLAQDVTQRVFADLARKATQLADRAVLSGWLYRSAQYAASDVVRSERRRRAREQETQTMNEISSSDPTSTVGWEKFRPVLDQVLGELADTDRDAIALRFLEEQSFPEIGRALRLSEDAARKRVERALDKMHALLARRGMTSTTAALALTLTGQTATSAPAGLAGTVAGAALAGAAAGTVGGGLVAFMSMSKIQVGILATVALGGLAGYLSQTKVNENLRREIDALSGSSQEIAALQAENRRLADTVTEVEALRRDDLELKQLADDAAQLKKRNEENLRRTRVQDDVRKVQDELDRINQEGNALVAEYKALRVQAQDAAAPEQARAEAALAAQKKMEAILAKQHERESLLQNARTTGLLPPAPAPASSTTVIGPIPGGNPAAPTMSFRPAQPQVIRSVP